MRRVLSSLRMSLLALCSLADVERKLIGTLSKGYRQRVGMAQVLLHERTE